MDKAAKRLAVIYVILLSLCAPLMAVHFELFTWFMGVVDMSYWTQTVLWFLPMLVYGGILVILGIWNMVKSFQIYKRQDMLGCINGMLIHKYGLVIFFCVNFIVLFLVYFMLTFGLVMGTRGLALLVAPVWLPFVLVMIGWSVIMSWLAILPGSMYSIQVIRGASAPVRSAEVQLCFMGFCSFCSWRMCWMRCIWQQANGDVERKVPCWWHWCI